jgi:hypothetical protein
LLFFAQILPPWASTILFEIYNPKPVPSEDFVANFSNSLGNISELIPVPVSSTDTITEFKSKCFPWFFLSFIISRGGSGKQIV